MPLTDRKALFRSPMVGITRGITDSGKDVVQLAIISPGSNETKVINVRENLAGALAASLSKAAAAIRKEFRLRDDDF